MIFLLVFLSAALGGVRYLTELGVPADQMILQQTTRSTREEAIEGKAVADAQGWDRLLVITAVYHAPRARRHAVRRARARRSPRVQMTRGDQIVGVLALRPCSLLFSGNVIFIIGEIFIARLEHLTDDARIHATRV